MTEAQKQANRDKVNKWRKEFPEKAKLTRDNWKKKLRSIIDEAKLSGCKHCSESEPICLDFHHRDPNNKKFNIGASLGSYSIKRVKAEITKCDIICANCHRKLHHVER